MMVMLNQRHKFIVSLLFYSAVVLFVPGILFMRLPGDSMLWREFQNAGHTPLFGLVALVILFGLRVYIPAARDRPLYGYLVSAVVSLGIGVMSEFGQLLTDRDPSVYDVLRDLVGIIAGLGITAGIDPRMKPLWGKLRWELQPGTVILSCILFAASLFPLVRLAIASIQRNEAFPVIIDFEAGWSKPFLQLQHAVLGSVTENQLSQLVLKPARYPGVSMVEPCPDWSAFESLTFVIHSTQSLPFQLVLRIHDKLHNQDHADRFNRTLIVRHGENRFRIPLAEIRNAPAGREMDMARITGLTLFAVDTVQPVNFYIGPLRLE
jgi:hypothetical protein